MFHINACSLNKNFDDFKYLLKCTNRQFGAAAVNETRITRNTSKLCNISLITYLITLANHLSYKPRNDLNIYYKYELESTFVDIINQKKVKYHC